MILQQKIDYVRLGNSGTYTISRKQPQRIKESIPNSAVTVEKSKSYTIKAKSRENKKLKVTGSVKILVINPEIEYCKTVWCTIGIGFTHVIIGAINFTTFVYFMHSTDIHAPLCCIAVSDSNICFIPHCRNIKHYCTKTGILHERTVTMTVLRIE